MNVVILPHKGVVINSSFIELGTDIKKLKINNNIEKHDNMYYLYDSNLQIETENNIICLITCCIDRNSIIIPIINGKSLFRSESDEVIEILNETLKENGVSTEEEHAYIWSGSDVCCWKEVTSDEVEELIIESKEDGIYQEMKADIEHDINKSKYFDTISIGKRGYYDNY